MTVIRVTETLTTPDEGTGYEGRCHRCGGVYKSALFFNREVEAVELAVECECGEMVGLTRIGTVRIKIREPDPPRAPWEDGKI